MINQDGILVIRPRVDRNGFSNAVMTRLLNRAVAIVLTGLRGCTSLIVVSEEAVWISHLWEDPSFIGNNDIFKAQVLDPIDVGDGTPQMPGLRQYTVPGGVFAPETYPQAVIVTPLDGSGTDLKFGDKVKQLQIKLKSVVAGLKTLNENSDVAVVASYPPFRSDPRIADSRKWVNGKVLFQYDPDEWATYGDPGVEDCVYEQAAKLKVWVENKQEPVLETAWPSKDFQLPGQTPNQAPNQTPAQDPTQAAKLKRAMQSGGFFCSVSVSSSRTTSFTVISSTVNTLPNSSPASTLTVSSSSIVAVSPTTSSSVALSPTASSLYCLPTSGFLSPPSGIPQDQIAKNVSDFCTAVDLFSNEDRLGCDGRNHDGILLSADCGGAGDITNGLAFDYPGLTAWINVTLIQGKYFILNSSTCNSAFTTLLNDCPPFPSINTLEPPEKFGGAVTISDGAGGAANFIIILVSAKIPGQNGGPGCAYVIANDLQNNALCASDYCNCGGTAAPLLTSTLSGSTTMNCAYSTQPATATCPPAPPPTTTATTPSTTSYATFPSTTGKCVPCLNPSATNEQDAGCPLGWPDWFSVNG
jgi:hypothetical protein